MKEALKKIQAARTALVLDQPFFGLLALRLKIEEDPTCKTAWVDGRTLGYNPKFIEPLTHDETLGLIAHEVMHCAAGHPWRRSGRDPEQWNDACDYAINSVLVSARFSLPAGGLIDPQFNGQSAEWIFDRMAKKQSSGQGQGPDGEGKPSPQGEVRDAPQDGKEDGSTEGDWQAATQQAAKAAEAMGRLPAHLERFSEERARSYVDWRSVLRRFFQETARADYAWQRPNTRYLASGLYLPSLRSEEMGPVLVAIDTSGSIDDVLLKQFASELRSIASETRPARVHVVYCDARIGRHDVFERDDLLELHPIGGGGTDFRPVFELAAKLDEAPVAIVYLTDLDGTFPNQAPEIPTLWATPNRKQAPFGETVSLAS